MIGEHVFIIKLRWDGCSCELLADDVLTAEYDKTGFLSVEADILDQIYLKKQPIHLPMVSMITKKLNYEKWG